MPEITGSWRYEGDGGRLAALVGRSSAGVHSDGSAKTVSKETSAGRRKERLSRSKRESRAEQNKYQGDLLELL